MLDYSARKREQGINVSECWNRFLTISFVSKESVSSPAIPSNIETIKNAFFVICDSNHLMEYLGKYTSIKKVESRKII